MHTRIEIALDDDHTVTAWLNEQQPVIELYVESRRGSWTKVELHLDVDGCKRIEAGLRMLRELIEGGFQPKKT